MTCERRRYGERFCHGACLEFELAIKASMELFERGDLTFRERFSDLYEDSKRFSNLEKTAYFWDSFGKLLEELPSVNKLRTFEYSENAYLEEILKRYGKREDSTMVSWLSSIYNSY